MTPPVDLHDFDFMFLSLQNNANNLLPTSSQTVKDLKHLGRTMQDADALGATHDSPVPAVYTYFGQFVDHDITLEAQTTNLGTSVAKLVASDMAPQSLAEVRELKNVRSAALDLDSLRPPAPADPANAAKMKLGKVRHRVDRPPVQEAQGQDQGQRPAATGHVQRQARKIGKP